MDEQTHYLDSGVFVAYINDESGRGDVVEDLLNEARDGKLKIITSSFALVEVLKIKGKKPLARNDEEMILDFFTWPFFRFVDANRTICERARQLIWDHPGLWPKDAVHLASALAYSDRENLDGVFSYDSDFIKLNGVITQKFSICEPFLKQLPLFGAQKKNAEAAHTPDESSQGETPA